MKALPDCRTQQLGVFTTGQAALVGLTTHALGRLVRAGCLVRLCRGAYAEAAHVAVLTSAQRSVLLAVGVCLTHPGSVLSHHTAALLHQLPMKDSFPARPALTVDSAQPTRSGVRPRVTIHRATLPRSHIDSRPGWGATTVARTVCDLARQATPLAGLVALDAALHLGRCTPADVETVTSLCAAWPGGSALPLMLARASRHAESAAETTARWTLLGRGYDPVPQVWAYDDRGPIGCGDLWLAREWVFVEIDGAVKYTAKARPTTLLEEKLRQERLEAAGFGVARVAASATDDGESMDKRVRHATAVAALARRTRAITGYVGPPPEWADRGQEVSEVARRPGRGSAP